MTMLAFPSLVNFQTVTILFVLITCQYFFEVKAAGNMVLPSMFPDSCFKVLASYLSLLVQLYVPVPDVQKFHCV